MTTEKPWGNYTNIGGSDNNYKVKHILVFPGKRLSLQSHNYRSEHWVIVNGTAKVQIGTEFHILQKNDYVYIDITQLHRIENIGIINLEFIETQIGSQLIEEDIIRYEDDYNRIHP